MCVYKILYIVEYSAMKEKKTLTLAATWGNLEGIMSGEISQTEKGKYCMISLTRGVLKSQTQRNISGLVVTRGQGKWEMLVKERELSVVR